MYVSVPVQGNAMPGTSTGDALDAMEQLAEQVLPPGTDFEWTELAYQERNTGNTAIFIFGLSVLFVFLALAAQYESWTLPLSIIRSEEHTSELQSLMRISSAVFCLKTKIN